MTRRTPFVLAVAALVVALGRSRSPAGSPARIAETTLGPPPFSIGDGRLEIEICAEDIVRVAYARDVAFFSRPTLMTAPKRCAATPWKLTKGKGEATIATAKLAVRVDLATGAVTFRDAAGRPILAERPGGRTLDPATVMGEATFHVRQQWEPNAGESLYGLGQHQQDLLDIKDHDLELRQTNTEISVPFLVSSRGYGILWDNTSFSRFGDLAPAVPLPGATGLYPAAPGAQPGDLAMSPRGTADWSGTVTAPVTGDYDFRTYSSGDIKLRVDGRLVIDHLRQGGWRVEDLGQVHLMAGRPVPVRLEWKADIGVKIARLLWKPPVAGRTDLALVRGRRRRRLLLRLRPRPRRRHRRLPAADRRGADDAALGVRPLAVPRALRDAAGEPRRARGISDARDPRRRHRAGLALLARGRSGDRTRSIPCAFPIPTRWIGEIHDRLTRALMISVWPKFYRGTRNFEALDAAGFLYQPNLARGSRTGSATSFTYYDAFNPAARALYWAQIEPALFTEARRRRLVAGRQRARGVEAVPDADAHRRPARPT